MTPSKNGHDQTISIEKIPVGKGHPTFIIAEAGINHNGDMDIAKNLIRKAKELDVDAIKFQSWTKDSLVQNLPQYEYLEILELTEERHRDLYDYCQQIGIKFLSSAFSTEAADLLENLGVDAYKMASMDLNNPDLLRYVAEKGKPMIVSTGMGTMAEVEEAVEAIFSTGNRQLILLQCTANYPPALEDVNLRAMETLRTAFDVPVGYSDHSIGISVPLAAVALGACVIEKHFTLDKEMEGYDHSVSTDPDDLRAMVAGIREIERALGSTVKTPAEAELEGRAFFRRSIIASVPIPAGTIITQNMLVTKRPGNGIPPGQIGTVVGKTASNDIAEDELINPEHIR